jgi:UPF0716 protein FxsA
MSITTLLRDFLGKDYLPKMILFLLVFAAVPLAEVFLFLYLGNLVGNYLVLVMAAVAGMAGALIAFDQFRRGLAALRARVDQARYPGREFVTLAGCAVAGILLITPGFITDVCGYLLLIPRIRAAVSRRVVKRLEPGFRSIYEYLRAGEL